MTQGTRTTTARSARRSATRTERRQSGQQAHLRAVDPAAVLALVTSGSNTGPGTATAVLNALPDLGERIKAAAAVLDRLSHNPFSEGVDRRAISQAPRILKRVIGEIANGSETAVLLGAQATDEWAVMRFRQGVWAETCAAIIAASAPETRRTLELASQAFNAAVSNGPAGEYAPGDPAIEERDRQYAGMGEDPRRPGLVLFGEDRAVTPGEVEALLDAHRPGLVNFAITGALGLLYRGEYSVAAMMHMHQVLCEGLRCMGAIRLQLDLGRYENAVSLLAANQVNAIVHVGEPDPARLVRLKHVRRY